MNGQSLLEYLSNSTNCNYISDLRMKEKRIEISRVIKEISPDDFSLIEWKDAYQYILGEKCVVGEQIEIKDKFLQGLS